MSIRGYLVVTVAVGVCFPTMVAAQTAPPANGAATATMDSARQVTAQAFLDASVKPNPEVTMNGLLVNQLEYLTLLGRQGTLLQVIQDLEERRADKQLGAVSSSPGTTTLVSKGTVPKVLALALENGAVTQAHSGTVVTFRTNVAGAIRALAGKGYLQLTPREFSTDPAMTVLSRISGSASFDTSRGTSQAGEFTADQRQLSQWTARFEIINHRDPNGSSALATWNDKLTTAMQRIGTSAITLGATVPRDVVLAQWADDTTTAVRVALAALNGKPDPEKEQAIVAVLRERELVFPAAEQLASGTRAALLGFDQSAAAFMRQRKQVLDLIAKGALASFEFTNDRPLNQPSTRNLRLVGQVGGTIEVTGNASVTLFEDKPASATGNVRDYELSGQIDLHLGSPETTGGFVLSVAGKWMDQRQATIDASGAAIPNTTGSWRVLQAKLLVPMKGTGAKIPFSVTFANRNELIKEKRIVRANVGVTYDIDMLFARFKPF
jgi:hypothetical protein